jgi:WD40 repeat protein
VLGDYRFRLPKAGVSSWMALDREGKFLAVPNVDAVALFDARTGELVRILIGGSGRMYAVAFSPDGKFLAGGNRFDTREDKARSNTIRVWDLKTGEVTATIASDAGRIWSVAYSPDGKRLVGGCDKGLRVTGNARPTTTPNRRRSAWSTPRAASRSEPSKGSRT